MEPKIPALNEEMRTERFQLSEFVPQHAALRLCLSRSPCKKVDELSGVLRLTACAGQA